MAPNITYNRKADGGDAWTVPIGLGVSRTIKMGKTPMKIALEGYAMVVHPDDYGPRFQIRFKVSPVIQPLIRRTLF